MTRDEFDKETAELLPMLADRLGIRARTLPRALRRAGRLLPHAARDAAQELLRLYDRLEHPKLAQRTDPNLVREAAETIRVGLARHQPGQHVARQRAILWGEVAFRIFMVLVALLAFAYWYGNR